MKSVSSMEGMDRKRQTVDSFSVFMKIVLGFVKMILGRMEA